MARFQHRQQLDPLHRIETEVELEIRVRRHLGAAEMGGNRRRVGGPRGVGQPGAFVGGRRTIGAWGVRELPRQPFDFAPSQFARRGSGQRLERDVVAQNALVRRQLDRQALELEAHDLAEVHDAAFAHDLLVRHDHRVQALGGWLTRPAQAEHAELLDERRAAVVRFDLLGIEILSRAQHDHFLLAPCDVQAALTIEPAKISRVEPPVTNDVGRGIRPLVILAHDDRSANEHLAAGIARRRFRPERTDRPAWSDRSRSVSPRQAVGGRLTC